jgi:hypothetical protein
MKEMVQWKLEEFMQEFVFIRLVKNYTPKGKRNQERPLKTLLDV